MFWSVSEFCALLIHQVYSLVMKDVLLNIHSENSSYSRSSRNLDSSNFHEDAETLFSKSYFFEIEISAKNHESEIFSAEKIHAFNQSFSVSSMRVSHNSTNFKRWINVFQHRTSNDDDFFQELDAYAFTRNRKHFLFFCNILVTIIVALVITFIILLTQSKRGFT